MDLSTFAFIIGVAAAIGVIGVCFEIFMIARKIDIMNEGIAHLMAMGVLQMENSSIMNDNILDLMECYIDDEEYDCTTEPGSLEYDDDVEVETDSGCDKDYFKPFTEVHIKDSEHTNRIASPPSKIIKWAQEILSSM